MAIYGYHRTSTQEQHLDRGVNAIYDYCKANNTELDVMFTDQQTGKNFSRPDYQAMKRVAKAGSCIIISEIDRLGRDKTDTLKELRHFKDMGVRVMILEIPTTLVDYGKLDNGMAAMLMETINNMLIEMYATFAHAEMLKRETRQKQGIQAMKDRGDWDNYGRPVVMDYKKFASEYTKVVDGQIKPFELMKQLGMAKATYYKYAKRYKQELLLNKGA
ncbi:MAG: recombinase family protein [Herbinix sp.]|jgi:DNA invertase Pin-like site-specific DNA recombinase|nr:recombinase family protein [Herbinix sp.]